MLSAYNKSIQLIGSIFVRPQSSTIGSSGSPPFFFNRLSFPCSSLQKIGDSTVCTRGVHCRLCVLVSVPSSIAPGRRRQVTQNVCHVVRNNTYITYIIPIYVLPSTGTRTWCVQRRHTRDDTGDILWIRRSIRFVKIYVKTTASRQHLWQDLKLTDSATLSVEQDTPESLDFNGFSLQSKREKNYCYTR